MKKTLLLLGMITIVIALTACASTAEGGVQVEAAVENTANNKSAASNESTASNDILNVDYEGAMPVQMQLTLGTMMLEDTAVPLAAEQAQMLLPLWKGMRGLQESGTASRVEYDALLNQIQNEMTVEQLTTIAEMQLGREDMMAFMQETGLLPVNLEGTEDGTRGGGPGGGEDFLRGQGGGPGGDGDLSPDEIATLQAEREAQGGGMSGFGGGTVLYDALIEMLEEIAVT